MFHFNIVPCNNFSKPIINNPSKIQVRNSGGDLQLRTLLKDRLDLMRNGGFPG